MTFGAWARVLGERRCQTRDADDLLASQTIQLDIVKAMSHDPQYPATIAEVLDPPVRFLPSVIKAVRRFARGKPYRGTLAERKEKFVALHDDLCRVYGKRTQLVFGDLDGGDSGSSCYRSKTDEIVLRGKLSVVTILHEFAHALGRDERGAVRWSVNLFRECFPLSFARCQTEGHLMRRQ